MGGAMPVLIGLPGCYLAEMSAAVVLALLLAPATATASAADLSISVHIRVAACPAPARAADWVDEHLAAAARVLAAHGVRIQASHSSFRTERCALLTRADRDGFAGHVLPAPAVTVLVVDRVRDLDVPSYDLNGVHWRGPHGRRWIFLTARARPPTLAHELGHYFGLGHDPAGGNLMTPGPSSPAWRSRTPPRPFAPLLTAAQARQLRHGVSVHTRK